MEQAQDELLYVKVQAPGKTRWAFLGSKGTMNYLRVHAVMLYDKVKAQSLADEIMELNEGFKAKVVLAKTGQTVNA